MENGKVAVTEHPCYGELQRLQEEHQRLKEDLAHLHGIEGDFEDIRGLWLRQKQVVAAMREEHQLLKQHNQGLKARVDRQQDLLAEAASRNARLHEKSREDRVKLRAIRRFIGNLTAEPEPEPTTDDDD